MKNMTLSCQRATAGSGSIVAQFCSADVMTQMPKQE
jgi:hypothetical protein